jgi:asparagine synthase (glutamine-hydrolysing)
MTSDVPLGAFLSGGVDSSVVVASMGGSVKTFSIGFEEEDFDETSYARSVAARVGTDHRELRVTPDVLRDLHRIVWYLDEPLADSSALPTYHLAREARRYVTVALTGDGADETLGGYDRYRAMMIAGVLDRFLPRIPWGRRARRGRIGRFLDGLGLDPLLRYLRWVGIFPTDDRSLARVLWGPWAEANGGDIVEQVMAVDRQTYLPEDILHKVDSMTMACSLEARSPFLDHHVVALALSFPRPWKVGRLRSKGVLREAFREDLPRAVLRRAKQGFGVPVGEWLREESLVEILTDGSAAGRDILPVGEVRRLIEEHRSRRVDHTHRLWALLVLEIWMRQVVDARPGLFPPA